MSFLNKSRSNLSETSTTLLNKVDERPKPYSVAVNLGLFGGLENFRDNIRRQLTEKIRSPGSSINLNSLNSKFIDIASPNVTEGLKEVLNETRTNRKHRESPIRVDAIFDTRATSVVPRKVTNVKRSDLLSDIARKIEKRNSPSRTPSKDTIALSNLEKRINIPVSTLSPEYQASLAERREKSPAREYASLLSNITPNYKKEKTMRASYLEKRNGRSPTETKQSLIKILATQETPSLKRNASAKFETLKNYSSNKPSRTFEQLKSSQIEAVTNYSPTRLREKTSTTTSRYSSDNLKTLTNFVSESFRPTSSNRTELLKTGKLSVANGSAFETKSNLEEKMSVTEKLPISKLYEIQDIFYNVTEKEFNQLSSDYVEELIKLSSVIMQRVKSSTYYS